MNIITELAFERRGRLGGLEGQNSEVYLAYDHQLGAELVAKAIPAANFEHPEEFFAEARMLHDARHPNVVEIKYACRSPDTIYLVMPLYEGGSVNALLQRRLLTVREVVKYGTDFLGGLHHIHVKGLVHFDLKPTNVLIDSSGRAAVTDFGLTKYVNEHGLAEQPRIYETHIPPEALQETHRGAESDIYQAGLTLYRMCSGLADFQRQWDALPTFEAKGRAILTGTFPDRRAYPPHIPNRLRAAIARALQPNPADRYGAVLDLMNDLARVDEWLDWRYMPDAGVERWELDADTHRKQIERRDLGGRWSVTCTKVNHDSGRTQRVGALTGEFRTPFQADRAVQRALTEL